ncbi:Ribonucleotide reductase of class III (anaerobic), large subunit [Yersinia phage fHe-Yen9-03]|uniref:Ribonucleotide reductase of class III (Anaerobic), large subunit n=1 Tax=Yersinia phage fHe-Yen9-03 TaxID=2052743 RepID=A0A2C9CYL3_9CAUD|nr:Ribonucleotide reductase of class III (anaerobic), large subunit [Yersinia phage fHe-Yen9-03]
MNNDRLYSDINEFLNQSNKDLLNENANKDSKMVNTHRDLLAGILSKHWAEDELSEDLIQWHKNGYGHIHDLDYFISPLTNCCLVNYRDMLENGFKIGNAQVGTPNSIGVASTVLTQIVLAVSASQYGGQTLAHIDYGLEPYVQKSYEKLQQLQKEFNLPDDYVEITLQKEVYDAMQALLYQVNTITSSNGQTPFVTITLGLNQSKFGQMITDSYLKVHEKGLGVDGNTPVFPKVVFFLEDGVNLKPEDPNYFLKEQAMKTASKRIYPDFVSVPLNKKVTGSKTIAVSPMGCRSFLGQWKNEDDIEQYDGRFNLGVVSINLPLLALESESDGDFFGKIDHHMNMAYRAQMNRVERLKKMKARQNPTMFMEGAIARLGADETIDKLFYDGYASISIGFVGLAECSEIIKGHLNKDYCKSILHYMKYKCEQFKKDSTISFSLYGTPAESLCYKFAKCIELKYPNVLKRDFITNSFHQPVWIESSPFSKWDYEESFAYLSNGGNISYVETPNLANNIKALETLIDYAYDRIPYFGINQPVDKCYKCSFEGEFSVDKVGFHCPECDNREEGTMSVIRRVSGYLSAPNSRPFNSGKQQEVIQRIKHERQSKE